MSRSLATLSTLALLTLAAMVLPACKPSGNDAYAEALKLLGEAERGPCNMGFDKATSQQTIDVARVGECLTKTNEALAKLREAEQLGVNHQEIQDLITRTQDEVARLESMKRMVLRMEHKLDAPKPKPAAP
ncbi:hypothetical protein ACNOYE_17615 [Nannocystaceae bacterium ST9]